MARTIINLPLRNSVDESYNTAVNILQANGFKEVSYNGETVWKKGTGLLTAMQYIKIEFTDTTSTTKAENVQSVPTRTDSTSSITSFGNRILLLVVWGICGILNFFIA